MINYDIEYELDKLLKSNPHDSQPINLSYWNPGSEYKAKISAIIDSAHNCDLFDYQYYFQESAQELIAQKLGFSKDDLKNIFLGAFSQSTLSIVTLAAFFSRAKAKIGLVAPIYFSVLTGLKDFSVPYTLFDIFFPNLNEKFNIDVLLQSNCDVFGFTSPINSTSIYFNQKVKDGIQKLLDLGKWVIIDESLCVNGMELSRIFGIQEKLIYIYSPHKAIGLQGIKFSTIVAHKKLYKELDDLKDSYGGSLNIASQQGVHHFISKNFDNCTALYNSFWKENFSAVKTVLANYEFAHVSNDIWGHYVMIFLDGQTLNGKAFIDTMSRLIYEQGYFIYPGSMQGFNTDKQFCFRINLLLNKRDLTEGLTAVLDFFKTNIYAYD